MTCGTKITDSKMKTSSWAWRKPMPLHPWAILRKMRKQSSWKKNDTTWQIISRKQLPDQTILTVSCSLTQLLLNYVTPVSYKRAQGSNSLSLKGILHLSALLCDLRPSTYTLYHYNAHSALWTWHLFLCFQNIRVGLRTGLHISRGALSTDYLTAVTGKEEHLTCLSSVVTYGPGTSATPCWQIEISMEPGGQRPGQ